MIFFNTVFVSKEVIEYILIAALALLLLSIILHIRTEIKLRRVLRGKDAATLEDSIVGLDKDIKETLKIQKAMENYLKIADERMKRSIQGIHTVRFNPFKGVGIGGNQSFATAFINENGNGVVISSMHSRDRTSIYAKPIINLKSEYELTKEEKEAISKANPLNK